MSEQAWIAKPNGTIGCDNPDHSPGMPPPPGLTREEHVRWIADHAPPLTLEQVDKLAGFLGFRNNQVGD